MMRYGLEYTNKTERRHISENDNLIIRWCHKHIRGLNWVTTICLTNNNERKDW
jgi:hypothetical protein